MRLKSLEIKGFKSFANQTVINFGEDVIGIVGPNGSGKSNIVDAIRWVLGEQKSRELRLDQMSSVLFNGTKKRKAAGAASVSLTFENTKNLLPTDYHTVTITRILYRSGESEYRLNDVPCRLKDITSLFLDTGIGSNSYAIIALGMVDDILADKDDSRRKMFEQAAGVSKYKIRKRQTENKLRSTAEDLERVEDLLHEIGNNLKSLEKQARRAKRYFELKAEYKELSVELALLQMVSYKDQHKGVKAQIEHEQDRYRELDARIARLEADIEKERKANLDKEQTLSQRQRALNDLVGEIRGKENERRMKEQKYEFLQQNRQKLEKEIEEAGVRITQFEADIEHYRSELNLEKRVEARLEQELIQSEEELEKIRSRHGAVKADLDAVMARQQAIEKNVYELEKQKAINSSQISGLEQQLEANTSEQAQRQREVTDLGTKVAALETREKDLQEGVDALEKAETDRQAELEKAERELEEINREMARVRRELDAKQNEYKLTKSMVENLEGFPESIKFLSSSKEWAGQAPLLSDLIYVDEAYRIAIENYLEPYLNHYVVDNLEAAYQAIRLLGRSQKGKANFFVLEAFEDYVPPITLLPGTRQAIDLVQTDPAYLKLVSYLLENVLITDEDRFSSSLPDNDIVLLSGSGRLIQKRFSVAGGSIGLFEGKKIGRKKNLEVLDKAIKKAEAAETKLSTAFFNQKQKIEKLKTQHTRAEIQQQKNLLNQVVQEKVSLLARQENFSSLINDLQRRQTEMQEKARSLVQANAGIDHKLDRENEALAALKADLSQTDGSFRNLAEQLSAASTAHNEKNIQFIRQQNKVTALQREASYREKQLEDTRRRTDDNRQAVASTDAKMHELHQEVLALQEELLSAYEKRKAQEANLTEAEQDYYKARGNITALEDDLRKVNRNQQDLQVLINQLKEKFNDIKFEISSISQRLRIEFDISINDVINREPSGEIPEAELTEKVARLKSRLDGYGEINPMAVEAFDEMKERYDNISAQRNDIVEAKASLEKTIKEIEETATSQFLDAFEKARLYFIEVFRNLFTESDTCDLILLDPENPLESGIEIVAKPKGKRPQTISQLSGGEKTLTAIALLFALYLLKPAPFCIFDEVDAPLDDANILKFNRIIKKFSKDSQFIIVTHNKLTMAEVDTIYGVYMGEQGVSGVTAVDFRSYQNTGQFEAANN